MGQISALLLFGVVGYVGFLRQGRPYLAGCCGALTAIKPHLFCLFAILLLLEATCSKAGRKVLLGGALSLLVCGLIPLLWNPAVWSQYRAATKRPPSEIHVTVEQWHQPTLGYLLREQIPGNPFWLQFVPLVLACTLVPEYWYWRRAKWDWVEELPWLMLACALTACYGAWACDLVVLLPAVLVGAVRLTTAKRPVIIAAIVGYAGFNLIMLRTVNEPLSQDNRWLAPLTFLGYVVVVFFTRKQRV